MPTTALDRDLQAFALELIEHSGGVADWPVLEVPGSAVVPAEVVTAAQLPSEEFSLGVTAAREPCRLASGVSFSMWRPAC